MRIHLLRTGGVAALAVSATVLAAVTPASAASAAPGEGSAYGAAASAHLLPGVIGKKGLTVDTGKLAPSNTAGPTSASIVDIPGAPLLDAKVISSEAKKDAETGGVNSKASIVDLKLPALKPGFGTVPSASLIKSSCTSNADGVSGDAKLVDLNFGKYGDFPVKPTPNQSFEVPNLLKVTANEQIKHSNGSLTVNALHIQALNGAAAEKLGHVDIVLASSTCGKATGPAAPTTEPTKPSQPTTTAPAPEQPATTSPAPSGGHQVTAVPSGAPETGDGTLAAVRN